MLGLKSEERKSPGRQKGNRDALERSRAGEALGTSDRRRAEQALKESEKRYRIAIEHSSDGVAIIRNEVYVFVNQKFLEMFGYQTPKELLGRMVTDAAVHLPQEDREGLSEMDRRTQKGELAPSRYEFKGIRNDGTAFYVEASIASIVHQARPSLLVYLRDITERKQAESRLRESEEAMKSLLNATNDIACLMDTEGTVIAANTFLAQRLGREVDDLIGRNILDLFPKDIAHRRRLWAEEVIESGKPVRFEDASADGRYFDFCMYPVLDSAGKVVRLAVYSKDITDAKHASSALAESEARFEQLFDSVNDGISVRDARTFELLDANDRFCEMYGYTLEELKALPLGSLNAHESVEERRKRLIAYYAEVVEGASRLFEAEGRRKDGNTFWVEVNVRRITIGVRECLLGVARDITERREADEALKRSEEAALRLAQETGVIAEIGRIISSSSDIEEVYELFAEEVRKLIPSDRILVNLANTQKGTLTTAYTAGMEVAGRRKGVVIPITGSVTEQMLRTGAPMLVQPESIDEVQNRFPSLVRSFQAGLRSRLSVLLIARGELVGSLTLWSRQQKAYGERDIRMAQSVASQIAGAIANAELFRERKRAEEAVRESEESYRSLVETSPDAIFLSEDERFVYLNSAAVRLFGAGSAEEMLGKNAFEMVHPDDRESIRNRTDFIMTTGVPVSLKELRIVRPDGSVVDVEANAGVSYYRGRKVIQVIQRDITERKRAEEALETSRAEANARATELAAVLDAVPAITFIAHDPACHHMTNNRTARELLRLPEGANASKSAPEDEHTDYFRTFKDGRELRPEELPMQMAASTGREVKDFEVTLALDDGTKTDILGNAVPLFDQAGHVSGAVGAFVDITKRKRAEEALREERQRLEDIIKGTNVGTWEWNVQTGETVVNDRWAEIIGHTLEEISPVSIETWMKFAHPDDLKASDELIEKHFRGELDYYEFESRMKHKDENWVWVLDRGRVTTWTEDGKPLLMSGTHQDITERKQAEEKIRASLKEKEVLLKEIHHRVKNNLQIISSLLFLQATRTESPGTVSALQESRGRIKSMALIHERLYASSDLASVAMGEYTRNLVSDLQHSLIAEDGLVRFTLNLEDIPFGITEAIPCGLIINELVSNALKHAFPKGKGGEITVELQREATNQVALTVSDNGIGFPEHVDFRKSPSLGLTLINSLVEQLEGAIELDQRGGSTFTITFNVSGTDTISIERVR